jgi:hypothetical protein
MKRVRLLTLSLLLFSWITAAAAHAVTIDFSTVPLYSVDPTIEGTRFWAGDGSQLNDTFVDDSWTPGNAYLLSGRDDGTGNSPGLFDTFIGVSLQPSTYEVSFDITSQEVLPGGTTLWLLAYSGGTLMGSDSAFVTESVTQTLALNFNSDIDTLFIFDDLNEFGLSEAFHIDNFLAETGGQPVPEPSTLLLMASGLVGALAWRRRKSN